MAEVLQLDKAVYDAAVAFGNVKEYKGFFKPKQHFGSHASINVLRMGPMKGYAHASGYPHDMACNLPCSDFLSVRSQVPYILIRRHAPDCEENCQRIKFPQPKQAHHEVLDNSVWLVCGGGAHPPPPLSKFMLIIYSLSNLPSDKQVYGLQGVVENRFDATTTCEKVKVENRSKRRIANWARYCFVVLRVVTRFVVGS